MHLEGLLRTSRLLTLVGTGGVGKTRLALELASRVVDAHVGEVYVVELSSLPEPGLVPAAAASALGISEQQGRAPLDAVVDALRERRALVVLDNCEHLVASCAELTYLVLRSCPDVHILATSREPLAVEGEITWPILPLSLDAALASGPDPMYSDAMQLFLERARAVRPDFALDASNAPTVVAICRAVDGIPLAVELAAGRMRSLAPADILDRLGHGILLLSGTSRTAPVRQRTMRAALDWSYDLLSDREADVFEQLSVFAGGCMLEAAEAVCADGPNNAADVTDVAAGYPGAAHDAARAPGHLRHEHSAHCARPIPAASARPRFCSDAVTC